MGQKDIYSGPKVIIARRANPTVRIRRRRSSWWLLATIAFLVGLTFGIMTFLSKQGGITHALSTLAFQRPFAGRGSANILLIGTDNTGKGLADTLIVVRIDSRRKHVAALSIPRDTRAYLPDHGIQKINASFAFGGRNLTTETVSQLLGIPIDYYIHINSDGLEKLVDVAGGVELDVEKKMRYRDRRGGLDINLNPGLQRLNGKDAVGYVRFRHDALGDISRINRQQKFIRALVAELATPAVIPRIPALIRAFTDTVETDLPLRDLSYLARFAKKYDPQDIEFITLSGEPRDIGGINYIQLDPEDVRRVVTDVLYNASCEVEVVDASGDGQIRTAVNLLKKRHIEVVSTRVSTEPEETTLVIDYHNRPEKARQLQTILSSRKLKHGNDPSSAHDFTIVLGRDFIKTDNNPQSTALQQ